MIDDISGSPIKTPGLLRKLLQGQTLAENNAIDPRESTVSDMRNDSVTISNSDSSKSAPKVTIPKDAEPATRPIETTGGNTEIYRKALTDSRGNITGYTYYAKNNSNLPVELGVGLDGRGMNSNYRTSQDLKIMQRLENGEIDPRSLKPFALEAGGSVELFTVGAQDKTKSWGIAPYFIPRTGSSTAKHDDNVLYLSPFPKGVPWKVSQGENNPDGTHKPGTENAFSIDFVTNESDTKKKVTAMRSGTVVKIKEDSNEGGPDVDENKANEVWILHEDGSIAKYVHLKLGSATKAGIKVGDQVRAAQVIGNYGLTGKTDGPHLHVQVNVPKGLQGEEYISIAHRFQGPNGAPIQQLQKGTESVATR